MPNGFEQDVLTLQRESRTQLRLVDILYRDLEHRYRALNRDSEYAAPKFLETLNEISQVGHQLHSVAKLVNECRAHQATLETLPSLEEEERLSALAIEQAFWTSVSNRFLASQATAERNGGVEHAVLERAPLGFGHPLGRQPHPPSARPAASQPSTLPPLTPRR